SLRGEAAAGDRGGERPGGVRGGTEVPDHAVPAVRFAGQRPAQADEGAADGPRAPAPASAAHETRGAGQREPVAPLRHEAASGGDRRGRRRRRGGGRERGSASPGARARGVAAWTRALTSS